MRCAEKRSTPSPRPACNAPIHRCCSPAMPGRPSAANAYPVSAASEVERAHFPDEVGGDHVVLDRAELPPPADPQAWPHVTPHELLAIIDLAIDPLARFAGQGERLQRRQPFGAAAVAEPAREQQ